MVFNDSVEQSCLARMHKGTQISFSEDSDEGIKEFRFQNSICLQVSLEDSDSYSSVLDYHDHTGSKESSLDFVTKKAVMAKEELYILRKGEKGIPVDVSESSTKNHQSRSESLENIELTNDLKLHLSVDTDAEVENDIIEGDSTISSNSKSKDIKTKNIFGNYLSISESDSDNEVVAPREYTRSLEVGPKTFGLENRSSYIKSQNATTLELTEVTRDPSRYYSEENVDEIGNDGNSYDNAIKPSKTKQLNSYIKTNTLPSESSYRKYSIGGINIKSTHSDAAIDLRLSIDQNIRDSRGDDKFVESILEDNFVYAPPYPDHLTTINTTQSGNPNITYNSNVQNDSAKNVTENKIEPSSSKLRGRMNLKDNENLPQSPIIRKPTILFKTTPSLICFQTCHDDHLTFLSSLSLSKPDRR